MSSITEVSKILSLDLKDIPVNKRKIAKDDVREFLLNEVLRAVGDGKSPVSGEGSFKRLTKPYADGEKQGSRLPNLELEGDMLQALKTKNKKGSDISIHIKGSQAPKADGHNQLSSEAKSWAALNNRTKYKRRFIPADNQTFKRTIMKGIDSILSEYRESQKDGPTGKIEKVTQIKKGGAAIEISDLFKDEALEALLIKELSKVR